MYLFKFVLLTTGGIGIITLINIYSYRLLTKRSYHKVRFIILSMTLIAAVYLIFPAIYPNEEFYKKEFEDNTAILFPHSGVIVNKEATYPDIHGDYTSRAIMKVSKSDYQLIYLKLKADNIFTLDTNANHFLLETDNFLRANNPDNDKFKLILIGNRKGQFKIGFNIDGETMVFERHSS